jgi:guanylate cyclase, other
MALLLKCGSPLQDDDHAARMARFAIDAADAAAETAINLDNLSAGTVKIRIGMHSGPVTACVLGQSIPK